MINEHDIKDWDSVEVEAVTENEDGSMNCNVKMGPVATRYLLNFACVGVLERALKEGKIYTPEAHE